MTYVFKNSENVKTYEQFRELYEKVFKEDYFDTYDEEDIPTGNLDGGHDVRINREGYVEIWIDDGDDSIINVNCDNYVYIVTNEDGYHSYFEDLASAVYDIGRGFYGEDNVVIEVVEVINADIDKEMKKYTKHIPTSNVKFICNLKKEKWDYSKLAEYEAEINNR